MYSGSYVAIVTPMHRDGAIDWTAWSRLLDFQAANGTRGIVVGGTTGESPTLTDAELRELTVKAQAQLGHKLQIIVGIGTNNTATTVQRAKWVNELKPDGVLVVTPSYNKPTQEGLYRHFEAVAAASRVPVILYNVPGRTAVDCLPPTVERLARLPGIVALKEAVADLARVRQLAANCGKDFAVLSGDDLTAREAILAGATGIISVTANLAPKALSEMVAAARAGDQAGALALDRPLERLHRDLFVEGNPIPVKWCLAELGMIEPGIRLPLTPLSERYHALLREALQAAGLGRPG
jgi:4-hydroxy-tetrahydrodipicolinate synthase